MGRKMSLFDVIKYPISDRPTVEELLQIPTAIMTEWVAKSVWHGYNSSCPDISHWYGADAPYTAEAHENDKEELALLRKMIAEWDNQ